MTGFLERGAESSPSTPASCKSPILSSSLPLPLPFESFADVILRDFAGFWDGVVGVVGGDF